MKIKVFLSQIPFAMLLAMEMADLVIWSFRLSSLQSFNRLHNSTADLLARWQTSNFSNDA